jgi:hypothetical protein
MDKHAWWRDQSFSSATEALQHTGQNSGIPNSLNSNNINYIFEDGWELLDSHRKWVSHSTGHVSDN